MDSDASAFLDWPLELGRNPPSGANRWVHAGSNICLDFHGDPARAGLVVFSDGNHHMALEQCVRTFIQQNPQVQDVFYATTPPAVLVRALKDKQLLIGNLSLSCQPNVFISPHHVLEPLIQDGVMPGYQIFARSMGNVLLVARENPKGIRGFEDIFRQDVRLFISNPQSEKASYQVYADTLSSMATAQAMDAKCVEDLLSPQAARVMFGERIHHREAPQAIYAQKADAAIVYYHLALRYTRIFPQLFSIVSLEPTATLPPRSDSNNQQTGYYIGLIESGAQWGETFVAFMLGEQAQQIYHHHGLLAADNV